ncbi:NAD(P)/FAD-dependent oxidoreductase [Paramaledivibacter caminithermalis]|jgi:sarcosine oxidase subunit alpha|uniref:Sarcosine oxidase subunit alpha n=1 Tax=Paramaledivibacter caminithermalis (strain DSM 15212 / CIP 107654 / DViRD3) TaxID=1121301 RepID=A0A1M6PST8_PARC5|nr:FAD-dependent oxidoreductase [Paramaledivibacter caminithermalis]SHK11017.1 sarcosine oxidase subunit alpha [Paramaledivibacter caminithermalis DSM 15212]
MKQVEILVVGGGPAGLCAAINAAQAGAKVLVLERNEDLGGQLIKQTHMFFGSEKQHASVRGIDIASILFNKIYELGNIEIYKNATVLAIYDDGIVSAEINGRYMKIKPERIIVSTGASEKTLAFPNNDLPGIYGAGAVQTLMNVHGVKPGDNVLMVGAGNIGLIVSYQLMQAGVNVKAILDAAPEIGGYLVHASKVRRMGVPIYTGYTVKEAYGKDYLEKATIVKLNDKWEPIEGTEKDFDVDVLCISVGLSPLGELLWQAGCEMRYVGQLGGFVPVRTENLETTVEGIFVAGDVCGVEEATSAMVEGYLAGLTAADSLGYEIKDFEERKQDYLEQLQSLRSGHVGDKIRAGLDQVTIKSEAAVV